MYRPNDRCSVNLEEVPPDHRKGYMGLSGALASGALPAAVRERLALAAAEHNRCTYCLSAHTFLAKNVAKLDGDEIERARHAESADPYVAALLALSDVIARGRGTIDETTIKTARAAGVTDTEIAEVIGNLAVNILTNYFNIAVGTDNEFPPSRRTSTPDAPAPAGGMLPDRRGDNQ
jgi:AhpD family alkylhydroperoxidase